MRLGAYEAKLGANSHTSAMYGGATTISERHRHRYEVNSRYIEPLERQGLVFAGMYLRKASNGFIHVHRPISCLLHPITLHTI